MQLKGIQDLKDKIIRTPLSPYETFNDDPLRTLRVIRFASHFDYTIESTTLKAIKDKEIQVFFFFFKNYIYYI